MFFAHPRFAHLFARCAPAFLFVHPRFALHEHSGHSARPTKKRGPLPETSQIACAIALLLERMWRAGRRPRDLRIASYKDCVFRRATPLHALRVTPGGKSWRAALSVVMPGLVPGIPKPVPGIQ